MAIVFTPMEVTEHTLYVGEDSFTLAADEKLVIKSGPTGAQVDHYNDKVPNNKSWVVTVFVRVVETSA